VVRRTAWLVAAALGLVPSGPASAHAALQQASPRVGSTVAASPTEVRMWFSEGLEPAFSRAQVVTAAGQAAVAGAAVVDPKDRRELVIPLLRPLTPGRYRVKWGVVSVDGHRTEGDFPFTVKGGL